jgi:hypothetical protein
LKVEFKVIVQNDSKIDYKAELRLNVISGIMELISQVCFIKSIIPRIVTVEGQIILSNLLSGDYSVVVYYHDGKSYSGVANFVFLKLLDLGFIFDDTMYVVLISIILYIYYKWNKMRYIQKLKLREEELKHRF